jgi:hypothetical protein
MTSIHRTLIAAALLALAALPASPATAQRVFVAAQGSDANACTFAAPCRTFQHAHDAVAAGGEIDVLDPAGYGQLTITKSLTIQGHGFAGIGVTSGGTGITINAGAADVIHLNGLLIEGNGAGQIGITLLAGKSLIVENSVVHNLTAAGIQLNTGPGSSMYVLNTVVANIGNTGIQVSAGGGPADKFMVSLRGVAVYNTIYGIYVVGGSGGLGSVNATISNSEIAGSSGAGVVSQTSNGIAVVVTVKDSAILDSATGCTVIGATGVLRLAQTILTGNTASCTVTNSGVLRSYGDNYIDGNGDGDPAPTTTARK